MLKVEHVVASGEALSPSHVLRRGALLLQLLDSYARRYAEMLDGRSEAMPVSELAGGARIRHIYQDIFVKGLDQLNPSRFEPSDICINLTAACSRS